ncbi:MAG TPA: nucleoside-diphosphate sugar epimerase/dehydratase [Gaiellaceae bacterium]|jgi:FlaA1/EpsC-like NDP-sugar epimerase|nr:nucleoside-diphosphate sugar epimerase/dehydratase [Gaiellaceae bacterium]
MRTLNRHRLWQAVVDSGLVALAWILAFNIRFDYGVPPRYEPFLGLDVVLVVVGVKILTFIVFGLYDHWWRYVSIRDVWRSLLAVGVASILAVTALYFWNPAPLRLPRGVIVIDWLILIGLVAGTRLAARTIFERPGRTRLVSRGRDVLVVGAGDAGQLILREMLKNPNLGYSPIGLVDDDPRKKNLRLHGVRVLGTTRDLGHLLRDNRPDEVIIAIPSAAGETRQRIVNVCRDVGVPLKTLPAVHELISGDLNLARQLREVQVEDVLGREAVELDLAAIASYVTGETVLVTGAGGSIGSELCRQIAALGADRIILVDHTENALVDLERELAYERRFNSTVPVLADVKNRAKMRRTFDRFRPGVVFHAAAYKHVPLMEANPVESVRNNVFGMGVVAEVASEFGCKRFVLVSTDKAVNPKNVLGQTKAVCEWIAEAAAAREHNGTHFISVRFGNVLGSSGSVIPLFRRQIARGGPVTITHPEMTRYFMTIPEAVQLIIQAGAIGESGEIYVLDMGPPVKILDLAHNMIRLSGKEPDVDVQIDFIGVRPGEKLHEELWAVDENAEPTTHPKILRCAGMPVDPAWLEDELAELERLVEVGETLDVVNRLGLMVRAPRRVSAEAAAPETV